MSTKEHPGPFDGMAKAAPDEPVFTLRAHDPLAAILVRQWVELRRQDIRTRFADGAITEKKRDLEMIQCREAEELSWTMEDYRKREISGIANEIASNAKDAEAAKTYSNHEHTDEEIKARDDFKALERADRLVSNSAASTREAGDEVLALLGMHNERAALVVLSELLKAISNHLRPDRHKSYYPGKPLPEPLDIPELFKLAMPDAHGMAAEWREDARREKG